MTSTPMGAPHQGDSCIVVVELMPPSITGASPQGSFLCNDNVFPLVFEEHLIFSSSSIHPSQKKQSHIAQMPPSQLLFITRLKRPFAPRGDENQTLAPIGFCLAPIMQAWGWGGFSGGHTVIARGQGQVCLSSVSNPSGGGERESEMTKCAAAGKQSAGNTLQILEMKSGELLR